MKTSINLLPKSYYSSLAKQEKKGWISVYGFLAIFIVVLVSALFFVIDILTTSSYNEHINKTRSLYEQQQTLSTVLEKADSLTNRSNAINTIVKNSKDLDALVQQIISLQPKAAVTFKSFVSKEDRLEFTAIAPDLKDIAVFVNILNANSTFKNVQLINLFPVLSADKSDASKQWQFTLSINS